MIEIRKKLKVKAGAYRIEAKGRLELPFEVRSKSRSRALLVSGEEVALQLPRGEVLRGGDLLVASDGRVIEVHAVPENVLHITCDSPAALAKAAYHLGNRHVAVEIGDGWMRIAADHVLEDMLRGLGATVAARQAAFEPEAGAYAGDAHAHDEHGHGGKIHEYGDHADEHGHVHDPDCGHDHGHEYEHGHDHGHEHGHDHKKVIAVVQKHAHDHGHAHQSVAVAAHGHEHDQEHDHDQEHGHKHKDEHGHAEAHDHEKKHKPH